MSKECHTKVCFCYRAEFNFTSFLGGVCVRDHLGQCRTGTSEDDLSCLLRQRRSRALRATVIFQVICP